MIRLLTQVRDVPRGAVVELIANTYGGYLAALQNPAWRDRMVPTLERLLDRMIADGLIEEDADNLRPDHAWASLRRVSPSHSSPRCAWLSCCVAVDPATRR